MKKLTTIVLLTIGLASSAMAHHNAGSDNAADSMSDTSGHLNLFLAHHNAGSDSAGGNMSDTSGHLNLFIG
jgi:hypothetical protein